MSTTKLTQPKTHFGIQCKKLLIQSINIIILIKFLKNNRFEQPLLKLFLKKLLKLSVKICLKINQAWNGIKWSS